MSIAVKCNCGKMVYVEEDQRGQQLQCPHCRGVVAVPAGVASATDRPPANPRHEAKLMILGLIGLEVFLWLFSGVLPEGLVKTVSAFAGLALMAFIYQFFTARG